MSQGAPITLETIRVAFVTETDKDTGEKNSVAVFIDCPWMKKGQSLEESGDHVACFTYFEGHSSGSLAYFRQLPPVENSILKDVLQKVVYKDRTLMEVPITTKASWEN